MKIAMVGLGKLGLPVAVCLGQKHEVIGYDLNPDVKDYLTGEIPYPHREKGPNGRDDFQDYLSKAKIRWWNSSIQDLVEEGPEIIFVAVQTPHRPDLDGSKPFRGEAADFDYRFLTDCTREIARYIKPPQVLVIISTVLPGTIRREILPWVRADVSVLYNPAFPAMGTVMQDYLNPEFVLIGSKTGDSDEAGLLVNFYQEFYKDVWVVSPPIQVMSYESAELVKISYNLAISQRLAYINTLQEVAHKTPYCNVDDVTNTLKLATKRIISTAYMEAGGLDGGQCHPRDALAMSWLMQGKRIVYDPFEDAMRIRDLQANWITSLVCKHRQQEHWDLPVVVLGKAYKPESAITAGSGAMLVAEHLKRDGIKFLHWDPFVDRTYPLNHHLAALYLIATKHSCFQDLKFPQGSVVVDPFRYIKDQVGVKIIKVGIGEKT